jgi:hypothetical protein
MTAAEHEHRPDPAVQRATVRTYRAILRYEDPAAVHACAGSASCDACTAASCAGFGINVAEQLALGLVAKLAPDAVLDLAVIRAALLELIDQAERDLGGGLN